MGRTSRLGWQARERAGSKGDARDRYDPERPELWGTAASTQHAQTNCSMRFMTEGGETMLGWAVTFLIIALIAAVFGFGGIAAASAGIAKFLFFLFLVMCVIFFVLGWRGRGAP
jgi:uncharacterized membrane protein YtjA (UPF0391 family)